jgi:N-acetyl sugar amidotransferase
MDTSDSKITFDAQGICDHCHAFDQDVRPHWHPDERGRAEVSKVVAAIKEAGKDKPFDSILGMSGGLDSSYMLHLVVKEFGLRPLVFHVDGGWNSDIAVSNIQSLVGGLGLDLYTEVINWEEMRDLQLAFFKSGVSHLDIPQDHAFIATLYHFAHKHGIGWILNGGNISTECVRNPKDWLYHGTDMAQIRDIHGQFGSRPLKTFPLSSALFHKFYLRYVRGVRVFKPLDLLPYTKDLAIETLQREYGWNPYPQKHFESRFTKFFEGYWLPTRFGYDTRRVQFSSLVLTEQMTRDEALKRLERPSYDPETIDDDFAYVASKLRIPVDELRRYHGMPKKSYRDYKNQEWLFDLGSAILKAIGAEKATKR